MCYNHLYFEVQISRVFEKMFNDTHLNVLKINYVGIQNSNRNAV